MVGTCRSSWSNPRLLIAVFLVFLSGGVVGALVMRFGVHSLKDSTAAAYYTIGGKKIALEQLAKELDLSPEQTAQLETILDDFVMYVQMLQTQMDEVRANGKVRIMRVLDEKQKAKFEKMLGELQARR